MSCSWINRLHTGALKWISVGLAHSRTIGALTAISVGLCNLPPSRYLGGLTATVGSMVAPLAGGRRMSTNGITSLACSRVRHKTAGEMTGLSPAKKYLHFANYQVPSRDYKPSASGQAADLGQSLAKPVHPTQKKGAEPIR